MKKVFKAEKISDNVWWVGASDWNVRNFHGYLTSRGSTYNAYLIIDEKVTLIDTVKAPFADEMLARISSVIAPEKIDFTIFPDNFFANHPVCRMAVIQLFPCCRFEWKKQADHTYT